MRILYITKLINLKYSGVTIAVNQLLNSICDYAEIYWLDLDENNEYEVDIRVQHVNIKNYLLIKPDIAVFEDPFNSIRFCRIALSLKKSGVPYIVSPHGCLHKRALKRNALKKIVALKTIYKGFFNNAEAIQYLTLNEKKNSLNYNKSIIIPNGITGNDNFKVRKQAKKLVYIGRKDVETKGLDLLILACARIKGELKQKGIEVHIYGSTESEKDENVIKDFIAKNQLNNIVFNHGTVFNEEKKVVLNHADIFVQTSRNEGLPMSILEALSYGLPVVITENTNLGDVVSEFGAGWVSKTTIEDIEKCISKAINSKNISSYSLNAKKVSDEYQWSQISKLTVKCYKDLIEHSEER